MRESWRWVKWGLLLPLLLACNFLLPEETPGPTMGTVSPTVDTAEPATPSVTLQTETPPPTGELGITPQAQPPVSHGPAVLPASLYYLSSAGQVMRLEANGFTLSQITQEAEPITDFDVSPISRRLVYVSGNTLVESGLFGGERQVKVSGGPYDAQNPSSSIPSAISRPRFSPDGLQIAFGLNGVNLIPSGPATDTQTVQPSDPYPDLSSPDPFPEGPVRFFWPESWSPDGSKLLLQFAYYPEAGGLAIKDLVNDALIDITNPEGITCCSWAWARDSQSGFIASDLVIYGSPGLAQVDASSGSSQTLIDGTPAGGGEASPDNPFRLFTAPHQLADGSLLAFASVANSFDQATSGAGFTMHRVAADGDQLAPVRSDYRRVAGVLWDPGGSGAVIVDPGLGDPIRAAGPFLWLPAGDGPSLNLPAEGSQPRWGEPVEAPTASGPTSAEIAGLQDLLAASLQLQPEGGLERVYARPLISGDERTLWVAHSVGLRDFDPLGSHVIAVYAYEPSGWRELTRLAFGDDAGPGQTAGGPDFLGEGSVRQVFVEPSNLWIAVDGGIGAHGGLFHLLRFDGQTLTVAAESSSDSPVAGRVTDLNGDGLQEVLLDLTQSYIFAYASGVRLVDFEVQRWEDGQLIPVMLARLPEGEPAAVRDLNDRAVELATSELWLDAQATIDQARELDPQNETVRWNAALIHLIAGERLRAQSAYPLLQRVFAGDYEDAVGMLRNYSPAEIFSQPSPLVAGSAAEGGEESLSSYLYAFSSTALMARPELAEAYFLRAWATYLVDPNSSEVRADVQRAAELAPDDMLFSASLGYLS